MKEAVSNAHPDISAITVVQVIRGQVFSLRAEDNLSVLDSSMYWKKVRHVPVTDDDGRLVGIVTERDLLRHLASPLLGYTPTEQNQLKTAFVVGDIMTRDVRTIAPQTPLREAAKTLYDNKIGCLPIVENGILVGILTESDFVRIYSDLSN